MPRFKLKTGGPLGETASRPQRNPPTRKITKNPTNPSRDKEDEGSDQDEDDPPELWDTNKPSIGDDPQYRDVILYQLLYGKLPKMNNLARQVRNFIKSLKQFTEDHLEFSYGDTANWIAERFSNGIGNQEWAHAAWSDKRLLPPEGPTSNKIYTIAKQLYQTRVFDPPITLHQACEHLLAYIDGKDFESLVENILSRWNEMVKKHWFLSNQSENDFLTRLYNSKDQCSILPILAEYLHRNPQYRAEFFAARRFTPMSVKKNFVDFVQTRKLRRKNFFHSDRENPVPVQYLSQATRELYTAILVFLRQFTKRVSKQAIITRTTRMKTQEWKQTLDFLIQRGCSAPAYQAVLNEFYNEKDFVIIQNILMDKIPQEMKRLPSDETLRPKQGEKALGMQASANQRALELLLRYWYGPIASPPPRTWDECFKRIQNANLKSSTSEEFHRNLTSSGTQERPKIMANTFRWYLPYIFGKTNESELQKVSIGTMLCWKYGIYPIDPIDATYRESLEEGKVKKVVDALEAHVAKGLREINFESKYEREMLKNSNLVASAASYIQETAQRPNNMTDDAWNARVEKMIQAGENAQQFLNLAQRDSEQFKLQVRISAILEYKQLSSTEYPWTNVIIRDEHHRREIVRCMAESISSSSQHSLSHIEHRRMYRQARIASAQSGQSLLH